MDFLKMVSLHFLLAFLVSLGCSQQCTERPYELVESKPSASKSIAIVGMFGVHYPGLNAFSCGEIRDRGFQNAEAFKNAVKTFQSKYSSTLQDVNIQGVVLDSCGSSSQLIFDLFNLESCSTGYSIPNPDLVIGYIGPDRSGEAMEVAPIIGQLDKTVITHSATSAALVDPVLYPTLLRTVPSDDEQVPVMISVLEQMKWTKVQTVHSSNSYGQSGIKAFNAAAAKSGICIVNSVSIPEDASTQQMDSISDSLLANSETRAVIVFANDNYVRDLLFAMKRNPDSLGLFSWIGTNSWAASDNVINGVEEVALGAITIGLDTETFSLNEYTDYISLLKPGSDPHPWLVEYWQNMFQCNLPGQQSSFTNDCDPQQESLKDINPDSYVTNTISAVDALLLGLEDARASECSNTNAVCNSFINDEDKWSVIHDMVRNVRVNGAKRFNATSGQALGTKHIVYNYRTSGYEKIGHFSDNSLSMDSLIFTYDRDGSVISSPTSECGKYPCTACGEVTTTTSSSTTTSAAAADGSSTVPSDGGDVSDDGGSLSVRREGWIIALIVLAGLGILMVIVFEIYLMYKMIGTEAASHWRTLWLGQLLLLGILMCYLTLFAFVPYPTVASCSVIRFGVGVSYAMCFSVLLVKLLIILSSKTLGYLKGIFQILMFLFAWLVQIAVDGQWIILKPAEVMIDNSTGSPLAICATGFVDHVQSLIYVMFLILVCVLLAVKAHGFSTNYRESIFIGLSAGFAVPVWLAWILLGMLSDDARYQEPCLAFGLYITATLMLLVMFLPKVRQLNAMGHEGIYAEDDVPDYAGSIIAPSVLPPGSIAGTTNLAYLNTPNGHAKPVVVVDNEDHEQSQSNPSGSILRGTASSQIAGSSTLEPQQTKLHYDTNPKSLYLKHPGAPQRFGEGGGGGGAGGSVRSMPISGGYYSLQRPRHQHRPKDSIYANTRLVPAPNTPRTLDRQAQSEFGYGTARSVRSVRTAPSVISQGSGTLRRPKNYLDLGAL